MKQGTHWVGSAERPQFKRVLEGAGFVGPEEEVLEWAAGAIDIQTGMRALPREEKACWWPLWFDAKEDGLAPLSMSPEPDYVFESGLAVWSLPAGQALVLAPCYLTAYELEEWLTKAEEEVPVDAQ